jgi:hypothetical protein
VPEIVHSLAVNYCGRGPLWRDSCTRDHVTGPSRDRVTGLRPGSRHSSEPGQLHSSLRSQACEANAFACRIAPARSASERRLGRVTVSTVPLPVDLFSILAMPRICLASTSIRYSPREPYRRASGIQKPCDRVQLVTAPRRMSKANDGLIQGIAGMNRIHSQITAGFFSVSDTVR